MAAVRRFWPPYEEGGGGGSKKRGLAKLMLTRSVGDDTPRGALAKEKARPEANVRRSSEAPYGPI